MFICPICGCDSLDEQPYANADASTGSLEICGCCGFQFGVDDLDKRFIGSSTKQSVLPKNKMDYNAIAELKRLQPQDLLSYANELLEWVQDYNWPIAPDVCDLLVPLDEKLVPLLRTVMGGEDEAWIDNCVRYIVANLSDSAQGSLIPELTRIADFPTEDERESGTNVVAQEIINKLMRKTPQFPPIDSGQPPML